MTEQELAKIKERAEDAAESIKLYRHYGGGSDELCLCKSAEDVPVLLAEVRRLRGLIKDAEWAATCQGDSECPWCQAWPRSFVHRPDCSAHRPDCPAFGTEHA